jgi:hypothetical protein
MKILAGPIEIPQPEESKYDIAIDLSKRRFLTHGVRAAAGAVIIGGGALTLACGEKISFYVSTVIGSLETLSPLLPSASGLISKAVSVAKAFDEAYRAGKFADSVSLFTNLGEIALQIAGVAGVASPPILVAIAVGRVALAAIATILKNQMKDPVIKGMVEARSDSAAQKQKAMIERMADPQMMEVIIAASKP